MKQTRLNAPEVDPVDLLLVAGEHSGDQHAARLITEMYSMKPDLNICAVGGPAMEKTPAQFLFNLADSSVVGLVEVLKNYRFFKAFFEQLLDWISLYRPKRICFIDYPGFNLRLAKALFDMGLSKKGGGDVELYYYIAPQVWAWKSKRRFAMAKYLNSLGVIFPFEVNVFKDTDLPTEFVGHPFVHKDYENSLIYDSKGSLLLLPGSRKQAIMRIYPVLLDTFQLLFSDNPKVKAQVIYPDEQILHLLQVIAEDYPKAMIDNITYRSSSEKIIASKVITSSGTMSLKCALAGIPGAIVYRAHPFTYWIGKKLVKIPYLGIANILMNKTVYPEFIQSDALPASLKKWILDAPESFSNQFAHELHNELNNPDGKPASCWLSEGLI